MSDSFTINLSGLITPIGGGSQGIQGFQGPQGDGSGGVGSGAQGPQGNQGISGSGAQGNQGIAGSGSQGPLGNPGTQGFQGPPSGGGGGSQGPQGPSGSSSDTGIFALLAGRPIDQTLTGSTQPGGSLGLKSSSDPVRGFVNALDPLKIGTGFTPYADSLIQATINLNIDKAFLIENLSTGPLVLAEMRVKNAVGAFDFGITGTGYVGNGFPSSIANEGFLVAESPILGMCFMSNRQNGYIRFVINNGGAKEIGRFSGTEFLVTPPGNGGILLHGPTGGYPQYRARSFGVGTWAEVKVGSARGTPAVPASVQNGDRLGSFAGDAYADGGWNQVAQFSFEVDGAPSVSRVPSRCILQLSTAATGNLDLEAVRWTQSSGAIYNAGGKDLDFRIAGGSAAYMVFMDATPSSENLALCASAAPGWGGMNRGVFLGNATSAPSGIPIGGGYFYSEGGALKWKGPAGTVTTLGVP